MQLARTLTAAALALALGATVAAAQKATPLEQYKDWGAYAFSAGGGKVCYAISKPTAKEPGDRNHGDVFFFVTHRPSEKVRNEASLLVGYTFREGSPVTVDIDGTKYRMFSKGDGAWVENAAEEGRLIGAMKAGHGMTVSGTSSRGTDTKYTFSLSGVTAALGRIDKECN
ncbi:MAG TPA: invasion associated locus B family protein [Kaistiaceae bacterium]|nr:invasion associated locus B family protein [Kaistiaceae bacterium]